MSTVHCCNSEIAFRAPKGINGKELFRLAASTEVLDTNSEYAYILFGEHFADTCVIAIDADRIVGFVNAYCLPKQDNVLFIWQVAVSDDYRDQGLAKRMFSHILERDSCKHVQHIQATVTPSNIVSRRLFESIGRDLNAAVIWGPGFPSNYFNQAHKDELLVKIGPFRTQSMDIASNAAFASIKDSLHSVASGTTDPSHPIESNVKSYVRSFPVLINQARGPFIITQEGLQYLDFLSGAGTLNYGHNDPRIKKDLIRYIETDGLVHGLDMASVAKVDFLDRFNEVILLPRGLNYKVQFCGPTGTNAVEASLKLARKVTGRSGIISFTNAFHGMTLGALAVTGERYYKERALAVTAANTHFMPYCGYLGGHYDSIAMIRKYLTDSSSGVDIPASIIVETVQGEGGINVASNEWLRALRELCDDFGIILIVDDIQTGCGRTGEFFSFEASEIVPDIVLLSKSMGAYGLPMSLVLIKPELDRWRPGQHNGTFRGHNLAFVAATRALEYYWTTDDLAHSIREKSGIVRHALEQIAERYPQSKFDVRGRGLIFGLESKADPQLAVRLRQICFRNKLIIETCGSKDQVLKFMPPLTIAKPELRRGLSIMEAACKEALGRVQEPNGLLERSQASS